MNVHDYFYIYIKNGSCFVSWFVLMGFCRIGTGRMRRSVDANNVVCKQWPQNKYGKILS